MTKLKFHQRFQIPVDLDEEKRRFVQGIRNLFRTSKLNGDRAYGHQYVQFPYKKAKEELATHLGKPIEHYMNLESYIPNDFLGCLDALEAIYKAIYVQNQERLNFHIQKLLKESRIHLGVKFENGKFTPEGSELLDEKLIDDILNCLNDEGHINILNPFKTGLERYSESIKDESKLKIVMEDMYEALEAFAKFYNKNDKDLSANKEQLIKNLKLNEYYKAMLSKYIEYGCAYRHAVQQRKPRPKLNIYEVEAFIYMTGLFIRLGIMR